MSARRPHRPSSVGSRLMLATLASAFIVGIVAMHSLMVTSHTAPTSAAAHAATASAPIVGDSDVGAGHHDPGPVHDSEGNGLASMAQDCGPLLAACLALLLSVAGLLRGRRGRSWRVLWQRVRATRLRVGSARPPHDLLTPLQRTAVLRC